MRKKFEDIPVRVLVSADGPQAVFRRLDVTSGQRQDYELRRTRRECLRGFQHRQGETSIIYAARIDQVLVS